MDINKYAVVTGCSRGIGYAYCIELLKRGYNVIGVSRHTEPFMKLAKKYPEQKLVAYNLDLSVKENPAKFFQNIKKYPIDLVINNAGFGRFGLYWNTDNNNDLNMIDLNIEALQTLTYLFVKKFMKQKSGRIINISSIVGFLPLPYSPTYSASKAYVTAFSTAINHELKAHRSPVRVITVCPGATESDFAQRAYAQDKLDKFFNKIKKMPADYLCEQSLDKIDRKPNKDIIIIGFKNKCFALIGKIIPSRFTSFLQAKFLRKIFQDH